ncbi:MAG: hypothetical protein GTO46_15935 [Gemmatimonadetes bacterium]|nr:hypothetical protein [Gemmatimonadota bacterium]NIO33126.1 hypothetical protein [Gemmatimonadota bacterium]
MLLPLAFYACGESNLEPVDVYPLVPPPVYRTWWTEVAACTDVTARFERVTWYEAGQLINRETGMDHVGAWVPPHNIYVHSDYLLYTEGVKHEMVHELLQTRDHDSTAFLRCAGV